MADTGSDAGGPAGIQIQVTARVETDAEFAELGRAWLVSARDRLAGQLWQRLESGVPSVTGGVLRSGVPSLGRFQWSGEYSPENFELLVTSLREQRGEYAEWMVDDLANDDPETCSSADCGLQSDERWDGRVVFRAGAWFNRSAVPVAIQEAFVEFLSEFPSEHGRRSAMPRTTTIAVRRRWKRPCPVRPTMAYSGVTRFCAGIRGSRCVRQRLSLGSAGTTHWRPPGLFSRSGDSSTAPLCCGQPNCSSSTMMRRCAECSGHCRRRCHQANRGHFLMTAASIRHGLSMKTHPTRPEPDIARRRRPEDGPRRTRRRLVRRDR